MKRETLPERAGLAGTSCLTPCATVAAERCPSARASSAGYPNRLLTGAVPGYGAGGDWFIEQLHFTRVAVDT